MNKKKWKQKFAYRDSTRWLKHNPPHYSSIHGEPNGLGLVMEIMERYQDDEQTWHEIAAGQSMRMGCRRVGMTLDNAIEPPPSGRWRGMLAVREAREIAAHRLKYKGHTTLKLMGLMYWPRKGERKLRRREAAERLGVTVGQAKRLHRGFLRLVEERLRESKK